MAIRWIIHDGEATARRPKISDNRLYDGVDAVISLDNNGKYAIDIYKDSRVVWRPKDRFTTINEAIPLAEEYIFLNILR